MTEGARSRRVARGTALRGLAGGETVGWASEGGAVAAREYRLMAPLACVLAVAGVAAVEISMIGDEERCVARRARARGRPWTITAPP